MNFQFCGLFYNLHKPFRHFNLINKLKQKAFIIFIIWILNPRWDLFELKFSWFSLCKNNLFIYFKSLCSNFGVHYSSFSVFHVHESEIRWTCLLCKTSRVENFVHLNNLNIVINSLISALFERRTKLQGI